MSASSTPATGPVQQDHDVQHDAARGRRSVEETAAPISARKRSRRKVVHYYIPSVARAAEAAGLPTPYLCGRVSKRPTSIRTQRNLEYVGGLMIAAEKRDCRVCLRIAEREIGG